MGAIAKNLALQQMPAPEQQATRAVTHNSLAPMRIMDLSEASQLSQFSAIIVLLPARSPEECGAPSHLAGSNLPDGPVATSKLLEFFNKATIQSWPRSAESIVVLGDVTVNFSTMEADRRGEPLILTALEFKILKYLIQNARRVISRDELLNKVWGYQNYPTTRTVDNQVLKLRKKLERDPSEPVHFQTVHGAGYKFLP
jgi:Transcriptional regulatory protein, C terminal